MSVLTFLSLTILRKLGTKFRKFRRICQNLAGFRRNKCPDKILGDSRNLGNLGSLLVIIIFKPVKILKKFL